MPKEIEKVLFINDGSTDYTPILLDSFIREWREDRNEVQHIYPNRGYGSNLILLLKYAKENSFPKLITMDCDLQHLFSELKLFLYRENFDIISGSRYLPESPELGIKPPNDRVRINRKITRKLNKIYNFNLTDDFCGFKKYKLDKIDPSAFREFGHAFSLEFWSYAYYHKFTIKEVPVSRMYIINDKSFGENLDKGKKRYAYYLKVLEESQKHYAKKHLPSLNRLKNSSMC